ncbi:MAG: hypothetical protein HPY83_16750 [Anaerolineae bacterium]|nr:hypothetical protein [Anaerolineae bacterium]
MFESALLEDAEEHLQRLGSADIVIGIISYRNARTIGSVVRSAAQAVAQYDTGTRPVLVNVDANSSDGTAAAFMRARVAPEIQRFSTGYNGLTGIGSATRAVFEIAARLRATVCVVLDAALASVRPQDVQALLAPILENRAHLVLPMHQWSYTDASLEDLIVYPMVRVMYGRDARRPLAVGWAVSGRLALAYADQDVWETDAARSGIDVWLLVMALASDIRLVQVPLCRKTLSLVFGTTAYEQRFTHTVSTLLRHLGSHQRVWRAVSSASPLDADGPPPPPVAPDNRPTEDFWRGLRQGFRTWRRLLKRILVPEHYSAFVELARADAPELLRFDPELWARMVMDFGVCFNKAELDPDKVAASLAVPYYARSLSFWNELDRQGLGVYEDLIQEQALAFERQRDYLRDRWDSYVAWVSDTPVR